MSFSRIFQVSCLLIPLSIVSEVAVANPIQPKYSPISDYSMNQINNVNQLRDVQPTDWAYEALRSLVERYGCIVGYPDGTYRGNRALSRYEFAAGLNACLQQIERLMSENVAALQEDIDKLKRLAEEFATELASLGTRVDNLESRVAFLEDHQFSTTTRLSGGVIFALADVYGGDGRKNQTVLQERVNLNLVTSFTGKDLLITSLWSGNAPLNAGFDIAGTEVRGATVPSAEGTLSSQFGANTGGNLKLIFLNYQFPVGEDLRFYISQGFDIFHSYAPTLNPYLDDLDGGRGAVSAFGQRNPMYATGGGSGIGMNYQITDGLLLSGGYQASGVDAPVPNQGQGLFNGDYAALGQLTWNATEKFSVAGVYAHSYTSGGFGFNYSGFSLMGTAEANTLAGQVTSPIILPGDEEEPIIGNGYGTQFSWQPSDNFALSGWFFALYPRIIGQGDGNILSYALTFAFPDVGKEGNLLGFVVGAEPYLTSFDGGNPQPFEVDTPWHIEAFYRYQINPNISVTPGLIWLTAPNQDTRNEDDVVMTVRTNFQF
ncbi:MAG: iron uptake porin [Microcystaceae cyanobacterium]